MAFSLVARYADTGMFGLVISSSSPTVAAHCADTRAGVGAVVSQNVPDPTLGPLALDLMQGGITAAEAIAGARNQGKFIEFRQVLAVDQTDVTALHSGPHSLRIWKQAQGPDVASGGNMLANDGVPQAVLDGFVARSGHLGDRVIAAMRAGLAAGGAAGPLHSAGRLLVDKVAWPVADLPCDWTYDCSIENIAISWNIYKPQLGAYVQRAIDPRQAPSYGVPNDE